MTLTGGKRKVNKSLKAWVAFVKKVQKEEKLSYKDAIHRAKQRKDKGEKWMIGGESLKENTEMEIEEGNDDKNKSLTNTQMDTQMEIGEENNSEEEHDEDNDWIHGYEDPVYNPIRNTDSPPYSSPDYDNRDSEADYQQALQVIPSWRPIEQGGRRKTHKKRGGKRKTQKKRGNKRKTTSRKRARSSRRR